MSFRRPTDFVNAAKVNPAAPQEPPETRTGGDRPPVDTTMPAREKKPWEAANPRIKVMFSVRLPEATHQKLHWLAERVPGSSMHSIVLEAIDRRLESLMREFDQ